MKPSQSLQVDAEEQALMSMQGSKNMDRARVTDVTPFVVFPIHKQRHVTLKADSLVS